ncbi:MAG: beta-N-acetylglucosaminidase domain-containing protein, partial [bacterium]
AEVFVTNKLYEKLKEKDPNLRLAFVPNQYWGVTPTVYMKVVKEKLHPDVAVGWTGMEITSASITAEDARRFTELTGKPPGIGDNWSPLGPLVARDPALAHITSGFVDNPCGFASPESAQGAKIIEATVADFTWNPEHYDPARSFNMALKLKEGNGLSEEALARLKEAVSRYEKDLNEQILGAALREIIGK